MRADTLKEAINLYEQELKHMETMEAMGYQNALNEELMCVLDQMNDSMERNADTLEDIRLMQTIKMFSDSLR